MHIRYTLAALAAFLVGPAALAQPDLSISATAEDASGTAGDRVSLSYTASLTGAEEIEDVSVGFYFSTDQTLSPDDALSEREEVDTESDEPESDNEQIDIPSSLSDGSYFILVVIDDLEQVTESNENNNTEAIPFTVGPGGSPNPGGGGGADLQATGLQAPPSGAPGDEIELEYTVANAGDEQAGESQIAFYLSANATLSSNDTFLTREDLDEVDANDSTDDDAEFTVPSNLDAGDYFLIAVADDRNRISEPDESNNTTSVAFTITGGGTGNPGGPNPSGVDLRASAVSVQPQSAAPGGEIEVAYTLRNTGTAESGETQVGIYFSTDRNLSSNDVLATRTDGDGIDAGDSEDSDEDVTVPASLAPGSYFVIVAADDRNAVRESNENNNTASVTFTVSGGGTGGGDGQADLRVTSASAEPTNPVFGDPVETEFEIANTGTSQAGASTVALYLSRDRSLSTSDVLLGSTSIDEVDADGDEDGEIDFMAPTDQEAGDYFLLFVADDGNAVSERRESNNVRAIPFTLRFPVASEETAEAAFRFESVAPNPMRASASVRFTTDAAGPVRLTAVDALGREVAVLADGALSAGSHEARLDADALAPGVYVLRLEAAGAVQVQTVTVVR